MMSHLAENSLGNRVTRNGGHQLMVSGTPDSATRPAWRVGATNGCTTPNLFCGYSGAAYGVYASGADVNASANSWISATPAPGLDYSSVSGTVTATPDCGDGLPVCPP